MKMLGKGILEVNGKEYLVFEHSKLNGDIQEETEYPGTTTFYVARLFRIEDDKGDVVSKSDRFVSPRWITIRGPYVINWFPRLRVFDVDNPWKETPVFSEEDKDAPEM